MRVLVLSDFHLGSRASRAEAVLAALEPVARQYDRVILNGDTLDRYERPDCTLDSERHLERVRNALRSRHGQPETLPGNHDPALGPAHWIYLPESETLIFHGDIVQDYTHPCKATDVALATHLRETWARRHEGGGGRPSKLEELAVAYRAAQREFLARNDWIHHELQSGAMAYLMRALLPPTRPFYILSYWRRAPRMVAELARTFSQPVKHAVVGHTHRSGIFQQGSVRVLNTGSYMPLSTPCAVCVEDGVPRLTPVESLTRGRVQVAASEPAVAPPG
jgi:predicted phosphodiesterase